MLDIKTRQEYLKALGFYKGEIDGIAGPLTKQAYLDLQKKYFTREKDIDGIYGPNTDKLLQNAYHIYKYCRNFRLEEFKCQCGGKYCSGYPVILKPQLLMNIQKVRDKYGSTVITSGMRCEQHNANISNSSANSRHKQGKALDFKNAKTQAEEGRQEVMDFWKSLPQFRYTYCRIGNKNTWMGNAVHGDIQ